MPQFETEYEAKLYGDRVASLEKIAEIGQRLGLSYAEATYPNSFAFTHTIPALRAFGESKSGEELEASPLEAAIAGRLVAHRAQGKAGFAQLQGGGERIQIYVRKDDVGEDVFELYKLLHLGDHIGVRGTLMRTRTGELTLKAHAISLHGHEGKPAISFLTKATLALPDKYHGLEDVEMRYRQRYVDLIMNSGTTPKVEPSAALPSTVSSRPERSEVERPAASPATNSVILSEAASAAQKTAVILSEGAPASKKTAVILSGAQSAESKDPDAPSSAINPPHLPATDADTTGRGVAASLSSLIQNTSTEGASAPGSSAETLKGAGSGPAAEAHLAPRISAVTDTAAPNEEHNDAPRNVREVFVKRAAVLRAIRKFFDERGYLEVETPMLHTVAGGAAARPFTTHHNALDIPLSLRIAPELFLKRLVVGGMDRVYEINRNFRNEGVSTRHNPEFTMLEFYQGYANYHDLMDLTEELIKFVAMEVNGTTITHFNGNEIDLSRWQKLSMREAIVKFWPDNVDHKPTLLDLSTDKAFRDWAQTCQFVKVPRDGCDEELDTPRQMLAAKIRGMFASYPTIKIESGGRGGPELSFSDPVGKQIATLFELLAEPHLIQPTIIYDFPLAVSPLSKIKPDEPDWVERFEFYIGGFEVGNAFSELNDAEDQRRRFKAQLEAKAAGDEEAMGEMDDDYVRALGYGMPPTAGEGIGIDRLTMLLTGSRSIRDVILFPLMRPQGAAAQTKFAGEAKTEGGESAE